MNGIVLANLWQHASYAIPLTWIAKFHVLGLLLFYNTYLEFYEQEKKGVTQQGFRHWTKDCENMDRWLPK